MTPWPASRRDGRSNRATVARLGAVDVATLPPLPDGSPPSLAAGGATLPLAAGSSRAVAVTVDPTPALMSPPIR